MGFFKDLKEDLSLAVSEFANEVDISEKETEDIDVFSAAEEAMGIEHVEEEVESEPVIEEALSSFLDQVAAKAEEAETQYDDRLDDIPEKKITPKTEEMSFAAKAAMAKAAIAAYEDKIPPAPEKYESTYDSSYASAYEEKSYSYEEQKTTYPEKVEIQPTDELAVVTGNMVVNGDMSSTGSLDVMGTVSGNIKVLGELNISGVVNGSCEAATIVATNCNIVGNLVSGGSIKIGSKAVIKGNIYATSAVISGAIKGDIDVHGPVILDSTAIVMGNIKSKAVQINSGAAVEGMCSQCYADVSPSAFFRE